MQKGISAVIAVILLLLITIAIVGFAFTFFQRTTQTTTQSGEQQLQQQISQVGSQLSIDGVDKNQVYIRNLGTMPLTGLSFYVNSVQVGYAGPALLNSSQVGTYFLNDAQLAMLPDPAELRVTTAGFSNHITADFYGNYDAAYWKFDEESGTNAVDSSGSNNNGQVSGNPSWVTGQVGSAMQFDGVDDGVFVPDSQSLRITAYTVSVWIRPQVDSNGDFWTGVVGKPGRNFNFWLGDSSNSGGGYVHHRFHSTVGGTNDGCNPDTATGSIPMNTWTHVIITNDGITCKTFINDRQIVSGTVSGRLVIDNTPVHIGRNLDNPAPGPITNHYTGLIDEVRILNIARSMTTA